MIASTQTNHPLAHVGTQTIGRDAPLEIACARLKSAGLRITQPRVAILKTLIEHAGPASIEQIHQGLNTNACDLVTVYRCLAAFENIGIVRRSFHHSGTSLYQIDRGDSTDYHLICKADNSIRPLSENAVARLTETVRRVEAELRAQGFTNVSHSVEFFADGLEENRSGETQVIDSDHDVQIHAAI